MAINYGLDRLNFDRLVQQTSQNMRSLAETDFKLTMEQHKKISDLLTQEKLSGIQEAQAKDVQDKFKTLNDHAVSMYKEAEKSGSQRLSQMQMAQLSSARAEVDGTIAQYQAVNKRYMDALAKNAQEPNKYFQVATADNLEGYFKDPTNSKWFNTEFLISAAPSLDKFVNETAKKYPYNTTISGKRDAKGYVSKKVYAEGTYARGGNGLPSEIGADDMVNFKMGALEASISANQDFKRSASQLWETMQRADPTSLEQYKAIGAKAFPKDPEKAYSTALAALTLAEFPNFLDPKVSDVYKEPRKVGGSGGSGSKVKVGEGVQATVTMTSVGSVLQGTPRTYDLEAISSSVSGPLEQRTARLPDGGVFVKTGEARDKKTGAVYATGQLSTMDKSEAFSNDDEARAFMMMKDKETEAWRGGGMRSYIKPVTDTKGNTNYYVHFASLKDNYGMTEKGYRRLTGRGKPEEVSGPDIFEFAPKGKHAGAKRAPAKQKASRSGYSPMDLINKAKGQ